VTWQSPLAWIGAATIAAPILIHLLSRRAPRTQSFPSLRFVGRAAAVPLRLRTLQNVPLLLVRIGVLLAAVAALAKPLFRESRHTGPARIGVARAVIVDTSESMHRLMPGGSSLLDSARRLAATLAGEVSGASIAETQSPFDQVAGAAAWLATRPEPGALVIISDFQRGTIAREDLAALAAGTAIELVQLTPAASPGTTFLVAGDHGQHAGRVDFGATETRVRWTDAHAAPPASDSIVYLTTSAEQAAARAAERAARRAVPLVLGAAPPTARPLVIVSPRAPERPALLRSARRISAPWMADVALRLSGDSLLAEAARDDSLQVRDVADGLPAVARSQRGEPAAFVAQGVSGSTPALLVFANVHPGSLTSAALVAAIMRASRTEPRIEELDPMTIPSDSLRAWTRVVSATPVTQAGDESDGRWLWILALALLGTEEWMRRRARRIAA